MITFSELEIISKNFNLDFSLEKNNDHLKLSNHFHPFSIKEVEGKIMSNIIQKNNLKLGFEIATAFGVSACILGEAFHKTSGKLITVDSYIEENLNLSTSYDADTKYNIPKNLNELHGYLMAKNLISHFNLKETVILEIGWSPEDIPGIMNKNSIKNKDLDFIFIDGGHSKKQIQLDTEILINYSSNNCIIFLHDFVMVSNETISYIQNKGFNNFKNYNTPFNLVSFSKGEILI